MSFPKQSEIELPLLKTLQELGGKAEPKELYPKLAAIFPQLTQEDLTALAKQSFDISLAQSCSVESAEARREGRNRRLDARCLEVDTERPSARDWCYSGFVRGVVARASSDAERPGVRERV